MKTIKIIIDLLTFVLTGKGDTINAAVEAGAVSHAGQGRDDYGR